MEQVPPRQVDDATLSRLVTLARERRTSMAATVRAAMAKAVTLSVDEKLAVVRDMQAITDRAKAPGVVQTPSVDIIREDRDR